MKKRLDTSLLVWMNRPSLWTIGRSRIIFSTEPATDLDVYKRQGYRCGSRVSFCFFHIFPCDGQHQLNPVFLIDLRCAWVIIDRDDVAVRILFADFADHTFADDMIRQTAKRLGADNIFKPCFIQFNHFAGQ